MHGSPSVVALCMLSLACHRTPDPAPAPSASAPDPSAPSAASAEALAPPPVIATPPRGFVKVRVGGITPSPHGSAVLLVDDASKRALVVFIGETEALSIQLRLQGSKYRRPLTHDLLDNMLARLGAKVHSVRVDRLSDDVFYGVVVLQDGNELREFDSRTSDGVALALGSQAPVFVAADVLERAAVPLDADGDPSDKGTAQPRDRDPIAL